MWRFFSVQRDFVFYTLLFAVGLLMIERELVRQVFARARRRGHRLRPVVIVGDNAEGRELRRMFDQDPSLGYRLRGLRQRRAVGVRHARPDEVLGHVDDVRRRSCAATTSRSVMIAASAIDVSMTNPLVRELLKAGVHTELSPTLPDIAVERLTDAAPRPVPGDVPRALPPVRLAFGGQAALRPARLASWPSSCWPCRCCVVSLLIKVDSRGPVFYRQRRVGKNGRLFDVVKFRTMVPNAHALRQELAALNEADGPLFKIRNDPRITRIGRFLRKTSIDELPQLWNVLRGEMSLVGPRPALPEEAALWAPELRDRLRVQPGITGMWQVSGRSNTSFDEYSRLDLYYVDNWSLIADLSIMAKTAPLGAAPAGRQLTARRRSARLTAAGGPAGSPLGVRRAAVRPHAGVEVREEQQGQGEDGEEHQPVALAGDRRVEDDRRQQRRPGPQDQHAAPLAVAEVHQPVVQVALVGRGDPRAAPGPAHDGEGRCRRSARRG